MFNFGEREDLNVEGDWIRKRGDFVGVTARKVERGTRLTRREREKVARREQEQPAKPCR
jgi:hypothetical protein